MHSARFADLISIRLISELASSSDAPYGGSSFTLPDELSLFDWDTAF